MIERFISIVIPTHNQSWELDKTLFSIFNQDMKNYSFDDFEIIIVNTNPDDKETLGVAKKWSREEDVIRLIQVYDERAKTIKNATFAVNLGIRQFSRGALIIAAVDSARILTPGVISKIKSLFKEYNSGEILAVTIPYHFLKHSSTPGFTVEECRKAFLESGCMNNLYSLFKFKADTNISSSGVHNEATWMGLTKNDFLKVGGHNETVYTEWSDYNLDLFRRLTRNPPKDGIQIVGNVNSHWGKIGIGLKVKVIEGEGDFHLHHSLSDSKRDFSVLKEFRKKVWNHYAEVGECIRANTTNSFWGMSSEAEEVISGMSFFRWIDKNSDYKWNEEKLEYRAK